MRDRLGADIGTRARTTFNDEWLTQSLRQPWSNMARDGVGRAAGRIRYNQAHRLRRIVEGRRAARHDAQRESTAGQVEKLTADKLHHRLQIILANSELRPHRRLILECLPVDGKAD